MITLLVKQGKEIQEPYKIMERIEEFYSELYDSDEASCHNNTHIPRISTTNNGMGNGSCAEENEQKKREKIKLALKHWRQEMKPLRNN